MSNVDDQVKLIKEKLELHVKNSDDDYKFDMVSSENIYQIKIWRTSVGSWGLKKEMIADIELSKDELLNLDEIGIVELIRKIIPNENNRPKPGPEIR